MVTLDKTCRTSNGSDINAEPGVNPQRKDGRGNICPVTIILPTLAMEAKIAFENQFTEKEEITLADTCALGTRSAKDAFMNLLDKKIFEAKDMLLERFDWICSQSPASAKFMYENGTMGGYHPEEGIKSALKHGTLVVG